MGGLSRGKECTFNHAKSSKQKEEKKHIREVNKMYIK